MSISSAINSVNSVRNTLNSNSNPLTEDQRNSLSNDGFSVPANYSVDGSNLPHNQVKPNRVGKIKRNIITWFVPEFGTIQMYVNPNRIVYSYKKIITKSPTKGGFCFNYWGEDLVDLNISGSTGRSGIEGINVLNEIYRAEQLAFDTVGLTIGANNASNLANKGLGLIGGAIGGEVAGAVFGNGSDGGIVGSLLGTNAGAQNLGGTEYNNLAELAFTIEMYYDGQVFRGFFENFSVTESTNFDIEYTLKFTATQVRGYRTNYFPWAVSPKGPSNYGSPYSYNGNNVIDNSRR